MTRLRRILLWGVVLAPVAIIPIGYAAARVWLNHHLQREIAFGEYRLRLVNPILDWGLDFRADSVEIGSPGLRVSTGPVAAELRLWNSIASVKPSLGVATDTVRAELAWPESVTTARKRKRKGPPRFPNLRIPCEFRVTAHRIGILSGGRLVAVVRDPALYSQGPKGGAFEWAGIGFAAHATDLPGNWLDFPAPGRVAARWFGSWVRYQASIQDSLGGFAHWEGERKKSDLRTGRDSLEAQLDGLEGLAGLFGHKLPDFRDLKVSASLALGEHRSAKARVSFSTPPVWVIDRQEAEAKLEMEDSTGRLTLSTHGPSGETVYLQGRFRAPLPDSGGLGSMLQLLRGDFAGYSRNLRFPIGKWVLPGDAEIRQLRVLPGMVVEAQVRTRDSTTAQGRLFRRPDSSWTVVFEGRPSTREPWAFIWTDTNVSYRSSRVKAMADRSGLHVEAWVYQPRAYGSAADSVYAVQTINKSGYYLTSSRVYGKDAVWPVTGKVEWKRQSYGGPSRRRHRVTLEFHTQHPRYGRADYTMPGPGSMRVHVERLWGQKLPYVRLPRLSALSPVATGDFEWDIDARTGKAEVAAGFSYAGQALEANVTGRWDPLRLDIGGLDVTMAGSTVRLAGSARMGGRQFWQAGLLRPGDVRSLSLEARRFDASRLAAFTGPSWPVARGVLDGRFTYSDSTGFGGSYRIEDLDLAPLRKAIAIRSLLLEGRGQAMVLAARTASSAYPWLNDSLRAEVSDVMGANPAIVAEAASDDGLRVSVRARAQGLSSLQGAFSVSGKATLPGGAGEIRDLRMGGRFATPFSRSILSGMSLDSASFGGRYAIPGLDTQSFEGTLGMRDGRLRIPDLRASDARGPTLAGEAECDLAGAPKVTARIRGDDLALSWPGIQKIVLREAQASLRVDSSGLAAEARVGRAEFAASRPPISARGSLDEVALEYLQPRGAGNAKGQGAVPELRVKARLRDFVFRHKIGFRELQKSIGKVKVDKRKKRTKPIDLQLSLETAGANNRVETDVLRMAFAGDLAVRGVYPYTLLTGEFSSLKGELGQTSQSYDITDFDLKWQNATVEEGRISVEGGKKLRVNCKPETERTCNVYVKLAGRLDEMAFTYDTDCGANTGENLEPTALINSVSRGCWSEEDVAGAGNGNYGEAVVALLEPTLNEKLTRVGERFTKGWIKRTSVTGIGTAVAKDTTANEPLAIGVETKEKWGMSVKASAGYHPERREENTWESKVGVQWRPPLEKASGSTEWKRRVRDRVTLEASAETRPEEKIKNENKDARMQVGLRYRYKFWNLW